MWNSRSKAKVFHKIHSHDYIVALQKNGRRTTAAVQGAVLRILHLSYAGVSNSAWSSHRQGLQTLEGDSKSQGYKLVPLVPLCGAEMR